MQLKSSLVAVMVLCGVGIIISRLSRAHPSHTPKGERVGTVAGLKIRLLAVADSTAPGPERLADHAWTPDGIQYEGSEARLRMENVTYVPPPQGKRRSLSFELEQLRAQGETPQPKATAPEVGNIDIFGYLPEGRSNGDDNAEIPGVSRVIPTGFWHGVPQDSSGHPILVQEPAFAIDFRVADSDPQSVVMGVADGEFKEVFSGSASILGLAESHTSILASGPWGRIEATHLRRPMAESKPSPTHRFRLLGGGFPPKVERKALFFDSKGAQIALCGDGPNNPGYARLYSDDIARVVVQERAYEYVRFDNVSFEPQAPPKGYFGVEGLDHAVVSPIGRVVAVLKPTKDGPWEGGLLYAADGTRWRDPPADLAAQEYGMFDPWNRPFENRLSVLFESNETLVSSKPSPKCEVYAADSAGGPDRERLASWDGLPLQLPVSSIPCAPTTRPYLRLEVRSGEGDWRTVKSVPITQEILKANKDSALGTTVLEIRCDGDGEIKAWSDHFKALPGQAQWRPKEQVVRAAVRLKSGQVVETELNESGYSGSPDHPYRGLLFSKQANGTRIPWGAKWLDVTDIAEVEIQVQDLKPTVVVPLRTPLE